MCKYSKMPKFSLTHHKTCTSFSYHKKIFVQQIAIKYTNSISSPTLQMRPKNSHTHIVIHFNNFLFFTFSLSLILFSLKLCERFKESKFMRGCEKGLPTEFSMLNVHVCINLGMAQ